jgi:hypothetical protein
LAQQNLEEGEKYQNIKFFLHDKRPSYQSLAILYVLRVVEKYQSLQQEFQVIELNHPFLPDELIEKCLFLSLYFLSCRKASQVSLANGRE